MIKKILLALGALILLVLIVAAFQPDTYALSRSATISASSAVVFDQVNDLHRYQTWNPWSKFDPAAKYTHEGPPLGVGAKLSWAGNSQIGEGRMTIVESKPHELVRMKLEFFKPFASVANADFALAPQGNQTSITWTMSGEKNYMSKVMCMFMSMDEMVGTQFEEGLATLKSIVEKPVK
jgi:hypothetical protein